MVGECVSIVGKRSTSMVSQRIVCNRHVAGEHRRVREVGMALSIARGGKGRRASICSWRTSFACGGRDQHGGQASHVADDGVVERHTWRVRLASVARRGRGWQWAR